MQAFLGQPALKSTVLAQLTSNEREVPGWLQAKPRDLAKATGGFADSYESLFVRVEREYGIPVLIGQLIYAICKGRRDCAYAEPLIQCVAAISPGADLSRVWTKFAAWRLADPKHGVRRFAPSDDISDLLQRVAALCVGGDQAASSVDWPVVNVLLPKDSLDRSFAEHMAANVIDTFLREPERSLAEKIDAVFWLVKTSAHAAAERVLAQHPQGWGSWARGARAKAEEHKVMHDKLLELLQVA